MQTITALIIEGLPIIALCLSHLRVLVSGHWVTSTPFVSVTHLILSCHDSFARIYFVMDSTYLNLVGASLSILELGNGLACLI